MFTTKIAENAYVQTIYRLIRGLNVCNVSSQATGMQTKEDASNVQTNKSLTDWEEFAHHVHNQPHCLKITNATHAHKTHTTTNLEWFVSSAHQKRFTTLWQKNANAPHTNRIDKTISVYHAIVQTFGTISVSSARHVPRPLFMMWKRENVNVPFKLRTLHKIMFVPSVILQTFGLLKPGNAWSVKILMCSVTMKIDAFAPRKLRLNLKGDA